MNNKNILICLERLDIGGVETAVITQVNHLLRLDYHVTILAKRGIYTPMLEQQGVSCIEFDFELENEFNMEKANQIKDIIKEHNIGQVHIHQFPCVLTVFPACMMAEVPYIAYLHMTIDGVCAWFCNTYPIYRHSFPLYFRCAHKIIAITEKTKNRIKEKFALDEEAFLVIPNSLDFQELELIQKRKIDKIDKFLIVSRLSKEKGKSIENAIEIFRQYRSYNPNAVLTIVGEGEERKKLENDIKEKQIPNVTFVGAKDNVMEYINENDVVMAVDRCILEAISMKKIALIVGYDKVRGLVNKENIQLAIKENFSGNNLKEVAIEEMVSILTNLKIDNIHEMVEENYLYIQDILNIKNNCYIINEENNQTNYYKEFFEGWMELEEEILNFKSQIEELKQEEKQKWEQVKNEKEERIQNLEQELKEVYSSKRWRYTQKISKIFG